MVSNIVSALKGCTFVCDFSSFVYLCFASNTRKFPRKFYLRYRYRTVPSMAKDMLYKAVIQMIKYAHDQKRKIGTHRIANDVIKLNTSERQKD